MNWSRVELKDKAKKFLKDNYWETFLVTLIFALISSSFTINYGINNQSTLNHTQFFIAGFSSIYTVISIFVLNVIKVGSAKYFIEGEKRNINISNIMSFFKNENYTNIVKIMFLKDLYIFLWSLLFIIPGIVKSYEYRFIPYILAENPSISANEAFEKAKSMTDNQKGDIFILDLSFFGWYLLGMLTIIGTVFVTPYHEATNAQLYFKIKEYSQNYSL